MTPGNASGINDGGAAVVLVRESVARERGASGLVTLAHVATAAMEPGLLGYSPTLALRSLFERTGLTLADIDIVELNEALASQAVAVRRDVGLDPAKTNLYGGAIALGHPVGCRPPASCDRAPASAAAAGRHRHDVYRRPGARRAVPTSRLKKEIV